MRTASETQKKINSLNEMAKIWGDSRVRVQKAIHDFGAENIFFINQNYNCETYTYHYYNAVTNQEFEDYTFTWIGDSDEVMRNCITIEEAIKYNVFDATEINKKWRNNILLHYKVKDYQFTSWHDINGFKELLGLEVIVDGGRKYKGQGILIGVRENSFYDYYNRVHRDYTVIVYDKEQNMIGEANAKYCKIINLDEYKNEYNDYLAQEAEKIIYGQRLNVGSTVLEFNSWIKKYTVDVNSLDTTGMSYPEERKRQRKQEVFESKKNAKIEKIIKWIKDKKPEMTDPEEIRKFAEHIYKKNPY